MKIPNKRELHQTALNHSSDIDFKDFMNIYKKCTAEPYSFLVNDTTLPSDDPVYSKRDLIDFSKLIDLLNFLDKIKKGEITVETAKKYQKVLLENIKPIRKGNKNAEQKKILANINMLYNARDSAIKFIEDYGSMILEAKKQAKE